MNIQLARRAIRHYSSDMVPKTTNRHNQRTWMRSVISLGDRWLLAKPMQKMAAP